MSKKRGADDDLIRREKRSQQILKLLIIQRGFSTDTTVTGSKQRRREKRSNGSRDIRYSRQSCHILHNTAPKGDQPRISFAGIFVMISQISSAVSIRLFSSVASRI